MEDNLTANQQMAKDFRETLPFVGYLVAVKMLKSGEADTLKDAKRPRPGNTLCQFIVSPSISKF